MQLHGLNTRPFAAVSLPGTMIKACCLSERRCVLAMSWAGDQHLRQKVTRCAADIGPNAIIRVYRTQQADSQLDGSN